MFLKRRTRTQNGKPHIYYSVCESLRVSRHRVVQRQVLPLGELNTTQLDSWQHSIDVLHEDGHRHQLRLFTDRDRPVPGDPDVVEVMLSSFAVKSPRRFGDCWAATQLWEDLDLHTFWHDALADDAGEVPWDKVLQLLVVNRLLAPRSELFVHEKWFPQRARAEGACLLRAHLPAPVCHAGLSAVLACLPCWHRQAQEGTGRPAGPSATQPRSGRPTCN